MSVRNLMKQKKASVQISHPYARYTTKGLSCSLCSIPIKHEQLWSAHLTSKGHRAAVQQAVIQKQQEESRKRALEPSPEPAEESNKKPRTENDDLPEGFFDDPNQAPQASTSAVEPVVEEEEDEEWAAFERDVLADSVADGPTISAPAQLLEEKEEGKEEVKALQKRDGVTGEVIEDRPDETEEERRDREEREELMSRIDEEEREQQEADARVTSLRARLDLIRKQKLKGKAKG